MISCFVMVSKCAFLVVGPENSGTRCITKLLIAAGCEGDGEHKQRFDKHPPTEPLVVWRRSVPHAEKWPNLSAMVELLRQSGYAVTAVVTTRDWKCMIRSQIDRVHAVNKKEAIDHLRVAYPHIFQHLSAKNVPFFLLSFDMLVQRPRETVEWLLSNLELSVPEDFEIYDANVKYYKEGE